MSTVLVTGGSGFIASHCILKLLAQGYGVRATVRDLKRESEVRSLLKTGGAESGANLNFCAASLEADSGWADATAGCDYVLHVASPFPASVPKHEDELIIPAREGALRVLRAARDAGVKRVVLTSSFAAIGYGHPAQAAPFTEADWTDVNSPAVSAYAKSKTLAERAAWDFMAREGGRLELAVVNPVGVFGPALGADFSTSILIIKRMMDGTIPGMPNVSFGVVDVRDVADLHLLAMAQPQAKGERFLAVAGEAMSLLAMAQVLKARMGEHARRVPLRQLPDWLVKVVGWRDAEARQIVPELGKVKSASHEKATRMLGWLPRSNDEALIATGESLVRLGLLKKNSP